MVMAKEMSKFKVIYGCSLRTCSARANGNSRFNASSLSSHYYFDQRLTGRCVSNHVFSTFAVNGSGCWAIFPFCCNSVDNFFATIDTDDIAPPLSTSSQHSAAHKRSKRENWLDLIEEAKANYRANATMKEEIPYFRIKFASFAKQ